MIFFFYEMNNDIETDSGNEYMRGVFFFTRPSNYFENITPKGCWVDLNYNIIELNPGIL